MHVWIHRKNRGPGDVAVSFVQLTFLGVAVGIVFGQCCAFWLGKVFNDQRVEISITIFSCYLCFFVAEIELHASGVLACVFLGLFHEKIHVHNI